MPPSSRPLGLSDLSIALLVALLLVSPLSRVGQRSREQASRVKCASNLRQIGMAIQMYANANGGVFPRAVYDATVAQPTEYSSPLAPDPFGLGGPGPNDVTAALFLLLRTQGITSDVFVCPSVLRGRAWNFQGRPGTQVSNFPSRQFLNYSYVNPYATPGAIGAGFKLDSTLSPDFAVAADMNPGGTPVVNVTPPAPRAVMLPANSANHNRDGQNVLYADGHVEFQNTPFCGMLRTPAAVTNSFRDNIYTFGAGWGANSGAGDHGPPVDALDSMLLPTALDGLAPPEPFTAQRWIVYAAAAVIIALVTLAMLSRHRRKPAASSSSI